MIYKIWKLLLFCLCYILIIENQGRCVSTIYYWNFLIWLWFDFDIWRLFNIKLCHKLWNVVKHEDWLFICIDFDLNYFLFIIGRRILVAGQCRLVAYTVIDTAAAWAQFVYLLEIKEGLVTKWGSDILKCEISSNLVFMFRGSLPRSCNRHEFKSVSVPRLTHLRRYGNR